MRGCNDCVDDAREGSSYCQQCWDVIQEDARAEFYAGPGGCDCEKCKCPSPAEMFAELQDIKELACDEIVQANLKQWLAEQESARLSRDLERRLKDLSDLVDTLAARVQGLEAIAWGRWVLYPGGTTYQPAPATPPVTLPFQITW